MKFYYHNFMGWLLIRVSNLLLTCPTRSRFAGPLFKLAGKVSVKAGRHVLEMRLG